MHLLQVQNGKTVRVIKINGGQGMVHKLHQLGLLPGDYARVLRHAPLGGPVMVEVGGRSIALGRGVASRIEVVDDGLEPI
jgi:ferrous iron transport protein A